MARLLGTQRNDTCRGCIGGREKQGPGCGHPFKRNQMIIKVTPSRFTMKCNVCGSKNVRKLKRAS